MADEIEDGGPALPTIHGYVDSFGSLKQKSEGLSLRDWFAGQAIATCMVQLEKVSITEYAELGKKFGIKGKVKLPHLASLMAYGQADAMIAARKGEL